MSGVSSGTGLRQEAPIHPHAGPYSLLPPHPYLQAHWARRLTAVGDWGSQRCPRAGWRQWVAGRLGGGSKGDPGCPPFPPATSDAAGAAEQTPSRCKRQRCKAPPGGGARGPGPLPYLWPTSLPTEPPPRVGSSGLSPCGSSEAEPPAGAPPGPALPSDGERGSLARAILRERTAAGGGGGGAGRDHLRAPPRAPRAAAAVDRPGGQRRRGGAPPVGPRRPRSRPSPCAPRRGWPPFEGSEYRA